MRRRGLLFSARRRIRGVDLIFGELRRETCNGKENLEVYSSAQSFILGSQASFFLLSSPLTRTKTQHGSASFSFSQDAPPL